MSCNSRVALNIYHKYRFITNKFKLSSLGVGMLAKDKSLKIGDGNDNRNCSCLGFTGAASLVGLTKKKLLLHYRPDQTFC